MDDPDTSVDKVESKVRGEMKRQILLLSTSANYSFRSEYIAAKTRTGQEFGGRVERTVTRQLLSNAVPVNLKYYFISPISLVGT
jgi:hypothetical protein